MWIIGCRIIRALLNLLVTMLSARYLGPAHFGLVNYAASVVAFVTPVMQLGLNAILVQELVSDRQEQGKVLGTTITLNVFSSFLCMAGVAAFAAVANPEEPATLLVCALYSLNLPVQAFEMIQYWYQAELLAKYTSLASLGAYVIVSIYKVYLLVTGKSVYWFAVSQALDYLIACVVLWCLYPKLGGQRLSFSKETGNRMFSRGKYYILSAMMITVFAQTDRIMLKAMIGESAVGYYSAAVTCAGMTGMVFSAIIETARPMIVQSKNDSALKYRQYVTFLYGVILYFALIQSVLLAVFAELVVEILYGIAYRPAVAVLRIVVWYTAFSYLGAARAIWILSEKKHSVLWRVNLCGAVANVVLNSLLIPCMGVEGAALASLITQALTNVGVWFCIPELHENNKWLLDALKVKNLMEFLKAKQ